MKTLLLITLTPLLLAGCASTITAVTDYDPDFDFSAVRSVAILPVNRAVTSITSVSDLQASRIRQSLRDELESLGYRVSDDSASADGLLTWHLVTEERTDVRSYNTMSAHYRSCWNCPVGWGASTPQVSVRQFTQGTLIVDLLDPGTEQSVWRSVVEGRLRDVSPEEAAQRREEAVAALFAEFPPG